MTEVVLDASAMLALLMNEPGADQVEAALSKGVTMSSVNVAEVITKFVERDFMSAPKTLRAIQELGVEIVPFDADQARIAGALRWLTKEHGLSLGDRACLALGQSFGLPVLTTDSAWRDLGPGAQVEILMIR